MCDQIRVVSPGQWRAKQQESLENKLLEEANKKKKIKKKREFKRATAVEEKEPYLYLFLSTV